MSDPLPVHLVVGADPILREDAVRALVHRLVGSGDHALMVEEHAADGDPPDLTAAIDAARTPPFLTDRRIVVIREVTAASVEVLEPLIAYLADPLPTTSLVLVAAEGGRTPKRLADAVSNAGERIDTSAPRTARARDSWMADHLSHAPVRLDGPAQAQLDQHLGEDLGRLTTVLDALAAAYGVGARIGVEQLEPYLGAAGSVPPWELTDAIDRGDVAAALGTLRRLLGAGERHPLVVMATLQSHYLRMARLDGAEVVDEAAAAGILGIKGSTYPAKKVLTQQRRLGHDGVVRAVTLLAEADLALRGAKGWPDGVVLDVLIARLCRLTPARSGAGATARKQR